MSSEGKTDAPVAGMNPGADGLPAGLAVAGFQAVCKLSACCMRCA
jgi:hypothetical protein